MPEKIYLTRRNLLALLAKLDRKATGSHTACTIIKVDTAHPRYPQSMPSIEVTAVEDVDYYVDRAAGLMHSADEISLAKRAVSPVQPNICHPVGLQQAAKH